jgi:hypothetical protein
VKVGPRVMKVKGIRKGPAPDASTIATVKWEPLLSHSSASMRAFLSAPVSVGKFGARKGLGFG